MEFLSSIDPISLSSIDPISLAALTFAVVGLTEFVSRLLEKDYKTAIVIAAAAIGGAVLGSQVGISAFYGMLVGLNGSGLISTVSHFRS